MGLEIDRIDFTEADYQKFSERLLENLSALKQLLDDPQFGAGEASFGAELELYIVDHRGTPLHLNQDIQQQLNDPLLTLELNRFNLEYNFTPALLRDNCFSRTQQEAITALEKINRAADKWHGTVIPIGILPTLQQADIGYHAMTNTRRYHALTKQLSAIRGGPFMVRIQGDDSIDLEIEDVTLEGACTSFQIHLRVPPAEFADTYNALQLATPLVMALGANSPMLFGHRLWHETRVPLFKQSIDCRKPDPMHPTPARVNYGHSWLRDGALELFSESVHLYRPILPLTGEEKPLDAIKRGDTPELQELRLQQGSVWLWNRPVYDPVDGGHLRIEMRALPAGPTIVDMLGNAALLIGLTQLMRTSINDLLPSIPFDYCIRNFYRAAECGLNAKLIWPTVRQSEPEYHTAESILKSLLPKVGEQLQNLGCQTKDFSPFLSVAEERLNNKQTGAQWQLSMLAKLEKELPRQQALVEMTQQYMQYSQSNIPVAQWPL